MDCTKLTDAQLDELWREVHVEQNRRQALAAIPGQVTRMTTEYVAGGGTRADLKVAVEKAPEPTTKTTPPPPAEPTTGTGTGGTAGGTSGSGSGVNVGINLGLGGGR